MTLPRVTINRLHLLSPIRQQTPQNMFDTMYPNSFIEFSSIYYVNSGWDLTYPYLGQTANCNWTEHPRSSDMNPFLGYWIKVTDVHDTLNYEFDFAHMLQTTQQSRPYNNNNEYIRITYDKSISQSPVILSTSSINFQSEHSYIYSSYDNVYILDSIAPSSNTFYIGTSSRHWVEFEVTSQSVITRPIDTVVHASVNFNNMDSFTFDASSLYDFYYIHLTSSPEPTSENSIYLNEESSFPVTNSDWNCPSKFVIHNSTRNSGDWIVQVFSQSVTFYIGNDVNNWLEFQYDADDHTLQINSQVA